MTSMVLDRPLSSKGNKWRIGHNSFWERIFPKKGGRMYAIAFDLDQEQLNIHYPGNNATNAYDAIRRILEEFGFHRQQGSVYFGNETVTPVTCVMAVQAVQSGIVGSVSRSQILGCFVSKSTTTSSRP